MFRTMSRLTPGTASRFRWSNVRSFQADPRTGRETSASEDLNSVADKISKINLSSYSFSLYGRLFLGAIASVIVTAIAYDIHHKNTVKELKGINKELQETNKKANERWKLIHEIEQEKKKAQKEHDDSWSNLWINSWWSSGYKSWKKEKELEKKLEEEIKKKF